MINTDAKFQYWLDTAQYDLETAEIMLQTKRYLYVGFMCHQVVEKSLKAVIASKGIFPPKIHNLLELSKKAEIFDTLTDERIDFLSLLNPMNIEARYPSYTGKIQSLLTDKTSTNLLSETKEWFAWIETQL